MTATTTTTSSYHNYDHASTMESIFATMDEILSNHEDCVGGSNDLHVEKATLGLQLLDSMMPRTTSFTNNKNSNTQRHSIYHHNLLQSSSQITTSLQSRIDFETSQLEMESRELSSKLQMVTSLENQVETLAKEREDMVERKKILETSIGMCHGAMAAMTTTRTKNGAEDGKEGGTIITKKKMIPKIGKEVSLHALMTNIRWDYDHSRATTTTIDSGNGDKTENDNNILLAGEIFHPTTQKVKRFIIDKTKCNNDEYEIAESLWKLMEG